MELPHVYRDPNVRNVHYSQIKKNTILRRALNLCDVGISKPGMVLLKGATSPYLNLSMAVAPSVEQRPVVAIENTFASITITRMAPYEDYYVIDVIGCSALSMTILNYFDKQLYT